MENMRSIFGIFKNKKNLYIILIILIGFILRIWNFQNLFYFAIDEEKAAFITSGIANGTHFPLLGHPTSIGVRFGPLYYYLSAPFYKFLIPSPLTIGYISILVSIFTMLLLFNTAKRIDNLTGIISVFIYAFSYFTVLYDRRGWQLSFETFFILLIVFSLIQLKANKQKYVFILTGAVILLTQFEVGLFTLIPLILLAFYIFKIRVKKVYVLACLTSILIVNSGLLLFDLRHQFLNSRYFINYFIPDAGIRIAHNAPLTGSRSVYLAHNLIPSTLARVFFPFSPPNMAIQYANCPQYLNYKQAGIPLWMKIFIVLMLSFTFLSAWQNRIMKSTKAMILTLMALYFLVHFAAISLYTYKFSGEMAEYYILPVIAFFVMATAYLLSTLSKTRIKWAVPAVLIIFAYINISSIAQSKNPYGLKEKEDAVRYSLAVVANHTFTLDSFQTCWYSGSYRYLYRYFGKEPLTSYMDQYLYEYYSINKSAKPDYKVTILTPELVGKNPAGYEQFRNQRINDADFVNKFGAIEVYIQKLTK